ncbi:MAG: copper amine oxidase N-terminal domain-containing protein [Ruminococcaceae bacterium]|nr:copper amine oxidase N-terminal domain-containing protein [Oscillospiraceae bacterium]
MNLKRITATVLMFVMLITLSISAFATDKPVTVHLDGNQLEFDVNPIIDNGRTLVPMRKIFESLGATVDWIDETQTAIAVKSNIKIEITIGKYEMLINSQSVPLDVPAQLINGRTLVPARAVSEGLGAKVDWDDELRKVIITSQKDITDAKTTKYSITELSPEDTQILKDSAGNFRYLFEQQLLPDEILTCSSENVSDIDSKTKNVLDAIYDVWDYYLASVVLEIQTNSKDTYNFDMMKNATTEEIMHGYINILKEVGMDSASNFEVSYDTTPNGRSVLLLTFSNTEFDDPMLIVSKHIAVVSSDGACRYFTGELSPVFEYDVWMLCEITLEGRKNYGMLDATTKESFLNKIDDVVYQR